MQFFAQDAHVICGRPVLGLKRYENFAIGLANGRVVTESEINSAHRQPNVVQHIIDFVWWNHLANLASYLIKTFFRCFEPGTCWCAHVQAKLTRINRRKEIAS